VRLMQKQAPSFGRVLTMVLFALSCFGLLLFLWLSFGGPIPLKPKGYRVHVALPEATQLGLQADVRVAGVSVGHVVKKELAGGPGNRTRATLELNSRFAPLHKDARAILRQKTLLGETYLELTPGHKAAGNVPDNGTLSNAQVVPSTELDEIFTALDPKTRQAFRTWQQDLAKSVNGRGVDINDALGNLPGFVTNGTDLLTVLDEENRSVRQLFANTGTVFGALSKNESQLRNLVTNSAQVFSATASQNEALAQTFQIFPTFLDESKKTFARLKTFALNTDPLIKDLQPVARDLVPTLRATRRLAPDLRLFFGNLNTLITVSKKGLPALTQVLRGANPLLAQLGPFLQELNPILSYLEYNQALFTNFFSAGISGVADTEASTNASGVRDESGNVIGHYLRQFGPAGPESLAAYPNRLPSHRGNPYILGTQLASDYSGKKGVEIPFPQDDCNNTGGPVPNNDSGPPAGHPACWLAPDIVFGGKQQGKFPHVDAANYAK